MKKIIINIEGMHCSSCELLIKSGVEELEGVKSVKVSYADSQAEVSFDENKINENIIKKKIEELGYLTKKDNSITFNGNKIIGWLFGLAGIILLGYFILNFVEGIQLPEVSANMGYGLLFVVGLLTGFHCVTMCGGFVVSYTVKDAQKGKKSYKSHFSYGLGKLISYTVIGALFGLLGSIIAFTPMIRGVAGVIAGAFLILFGLKMLNIIPALRKIQIKTPRFITKFIGKEYKKTSSPLIFGLLNGLMIACGPLQAIYILAAGTGSMIEGAKLLFVFGLGTLPVMLGFGYFASLVSSKATNKILKLSSVLVIILGVLMLNNGLALTGTGYDLKTVTSVNAFTGNAVADVGGDYEMQDGYQIIRMEVNRNGWEPDTFVLKKDVPVKWIIDGKEITRCNKEIQVPKLGLKIPIKQGIQTIEFTPTEDGNIPWSCWMGMIPGMFIVKENIDVSNQAAVQKEIDSIPTLQGGSCGGSGGCGCGGG